MVLLVLCLKMMLDFNFFSFCVCSPLNIIVGKEMFLPLFQEGWVLTFPFSWSVVKLYLGLL
jgi:hypothetical protein